MIFLLIKEIYFKVIDMFKCYFEDDVVVIYYKKFSDIFKDRLIKNKSELINLIIFIFIFVNNYDVIYLIEYSLFYKCNIENVSYYELIFKIIDVEKYKLEIMIYINIFIINILKKIIYK